MRHRALCWFATLVTAAVAGTTLGAGAASADVALTPQQAVQGEGAKLTFRLTEDRAPAYTTRIELQMPESAPVAETYPMSDPTWAPRMTMRKLDEPLGGIHHGGQVTEVVSTIVWTRAAAPAPGGGPAELVISLGPMPQTDQMTFNLVQTYSDGHVTNWNQPPSAEVPRPPFPAPVLTLVAPPAADPAGPGAPDDAAAPDEETGDGSNSLAIGLVFGLLLGLAVAAWLYLRRPRPEPGETGPAGGRSGPGGQQTAGSDGQPPAGPETGTPAEPTGTTAPPTGTPDETETTGTQARPGDRAASGWRLRE
ncbi:YcnI family protein [Plantactinospora sp. WMMC1484]|uniref:YcnI family copper-binding membrane protein n=1 Tax=Plantactinospora sp. WMMC1484 TaxID=3404122 RepID=UPI003BF56B3A